MLFSWMGMFFSWVLRNSAQASVFILLLILVRYGIGHRMEARWRYGLWMLVVLRLVLPWTPESPCSLYNLWSYCVYSMQENAVRDVEFSTHTTLEHQIKPNHATSELTIPAIESQMAGEESLFYPTDQVNVMFYFFLFWLIGVGVFFLFLIRQHIQLRRIVSNSNLLHDSRILQIFEECKIQAGTSRQIPIVETGEVQSPLLCGWWKPYLLLPKGMIENFSENEFCFLFLHELAHFKHHDIAMNWLIGFLQALHWFNPLVWYAFHRLRCEREITRDQQVLSNGHAQSAMEYGNTILHLVEHYSQSSYFSNSVGILETHSLIQERIIMIAQYEKSTYRATLLSLVLLTALSAVALTDSKELRFDVQGVNSIFPLRGTDGQTLLGFDSPLSIAFSPDGTKFLTTVRYGMIFWQFVDGEATPTQFIPYEIKNRIEKSVFVPGKNWVLAKSPLATRMIDLDTQQNIYEIADTTTQSLAVSSTGEYALLYNELYDTSIVINLISTETGNVIDTLTTENYDFPTFTQDGNQVLLLNTKTNDESTIIYQINYYSVSDKSITKTVEIDTQKIATKSSGPIFVVIDACEKMVYSVLDGEIYTVHVWDLKQTKEILTLSVPFNNNVFSTPIYHFSPDGNYLLAGTTGAHPMFTKDVPGTVPHAWNLTTGEEFSFDNNPDAGVTSFTFSPDNNYFITVGYDYIPRLWNMAEKSVVTIPGFCYLFNKAVFSPDSKYVLSCSGGTYTTDQTAKLWDVETGENIQTFEGRENVIISVGYSPDGQRVITGCDDGTVKLWDVESGKTLHTFKGHSSAINAIAFSPDGKFIATASDDKSVIVWDASTLDQLLTFKEHPGTVDCLAFSPDSHYILSGSDSKTNSVILWDVTTGEVIHEITLDVSYPNTMSLAYSPDGKTFLAGFPGTTTYLFDVETGSVLNSYSQHSGGIFDLSFSPDGKYFSTGSGDNHARIFDYATSGIIKSVNLSGTALNSKISPDGNKWLVNNTVWDITPSAGVTSWKKY